MFCAILKLSFILNEIQDLENINNNDGDSHEHCLIQPLRLRFTWALSYPRAVHMRRRRRLLRTILYVIILLLALRIKNLDSQLMNSKMSGQHMLIF